MNRAFAHMQAFGQIVFNEFLVHNLNTQGVSKARGDILTERSHLASHRDNGHSGALSHK